MKVYSVGWWLKAGSQPRRPQPTRLTHKRAISRYNTLNLDAQLFGRGHVRVPALSQAKVFDAASRCKQLSSVRLLDQHH